MSGTYSPGRVVAGAVAVAVSCAIVAGGLVLYALRRNTRLFTVRTPLAVGISALSVLAAASVILRECVGEAQFPCVLHTLQGWLIQILVPSMLIFRHGGTYARHLLQRDVRVTGDHPLRRQVIALASVVPLTPSTSLSAGPRRASEPRSSTARSRGSCAQIDACVLRLHLHRISVQILAVAVNAVPWTALFIARIVSDPESHALDPHATGCPDDPAVTLAGLLAFFVYAALLAPIYVQLLRTPDAMHLRDEVIAETCAVPPLLGFFMYARFQPGFEQDVVTGNYAILFAMIIVFVFSVWVPALHSFTESHLDAPAAMHGAAAGATEASELSATEDGTRLLAAPTGAPSMTESTLHRIWDSVARGLDSPPVSVSEYIAADAFTEGEPTLVEAVRRVSVSKLLQPLLELDEAAAVLRLSPQAIASEPRTLRVVGALLLAYPSGRACLLEVLAREFCAELLSFMLHAASLRTAVASFSAALVHVMATQVAVAGDGRPPERLVAIYAAVHERAAVIVSRFVNPAADMAINVSADSITALSASAASLPPPWPYCGDFENAVLSGTTPAVSEALPQPGLDALTTVAAVPEPAVPATDNAPARDLELALPGFSAELRLRLESIERLSVELWKVEREVFTLLTTGPVYRLVQRAEFLAWLTLLRQQPGVLGAGGTAAAAQTDGL